MRVSGYDYQRDSPLASVETQKLAHVPEGEEDMSSYTEGQTHQLVDKLEAEGFTPDHVTKLGQFGNLAGIKNVLEGLAKIKPVAEDATRVVTINETTIVVNLTVAPKLPFNGAEVEDHVGEGWAVVEKRPDGLYVNGRKVVLYLSKRQMNDKSSKGYDLREELTGKPVLNANLLDALADNTHLIPEDWKKDERGDIRYIFFWATVYRHSDGYQCVRCLYFSDDEWHRSYIWLGTGFSGGYPAALLAS